MATRVTTGPRSCGVRITDDLTPRVVPVRLYVDRLRKKEKHWKILNLGSPFARPFFLSSLIPRVTSQAAHVDWESSLSLLLTVVLCQMSTSLASPAITSCSNAFESAQVLPFKVRNLLRVPHETRAGICCVSCSERQVRQNGDANDAPARRAVHKPQVLKSGPSSS